VGDVRQSIGVNSFAMNRQIELKLGAVYNPVDVNRAAEKRRESSIGAAGNRKQSDIFIWIEAIAA
jgi:hypothetical protein